jgi:hypothetical protein
MNSGAGRLGLHSPDPGNFDVSYLVASTRTTVRTVTTREIVVNNVLNTKCRVAI